MSKKYKNNQFLLDIVDLIKEKLVKHQSKIGRFLIEHQYTIEMFLKDDRDSILAQINYVKEIATKDKDKESLRYLNILEESSIKAREINTTNNRAMIDIFIDIQDKSSKSGVTTTKENAPKERNKNEKKWLFQKLDEVIDVPGYGGFIYHGSFNKSKFIREYHTLINEEFRRNSLKIKENTMRTWINKYLQNKLSIP